MWDQGALDTRQMAGVSTARRSNEMVWSKAIHEYLLGDRQRPTDLMAWSADQTRLPYLMYSQYLRGLFLENRLTAGRCCRGRCDCAEGIRAHVCGRNRNRPYSPWRSV